MVKELLDSAEASLSSVVFSWTWLLDLSRSSTINGDILLGDLKLALYNLFLKFASTFLLFTTLLLFLFLQLHLTGYHHLTMLKMLSIGQEIHIFVSTIMRQHNSVSLVNEKFIADWQINQQKQQSELPNFIIFTFSKHKCRYRTSVFSVQIQGVHWSSMYINQQFFATWALLLLPQLFS